MTAMRVLIYHSSSQLRARLRDFASSCSSVITCATVNIVALRVQREAVHVVLAELDPNAPASLALVQACEAAGVAVYALLDHIGQERALRELWSAGLSGTLVVEAGASDSDLRGQIERIIRRSPRTRPVPVDQSDRQSPFVPPPQSPSPPLPTSKNFGAETPMRSVSVSRRPWSGRPRLIGIGVSTGGPEALHRLLPQFPADTPPVLIVQHMREGFTAALAADLNGICAAQVVEASHSLPIEYGQIIIAKGNTHLGIDYLSGRLCAVTVREPPRNHHRPSVDVLFESMAHCLGAACVGVILTGMGDDGARGLAMLRGVGARTIAQDQASCTVFGMPRAAIERGAAQEILPLNKIAAALYSQELRAAS